jgi:DGQHR domain-containing protein
MKILDNRNDIDLKTGEFATLVAVKGNQFGRDVYSTAIKFKDLEYFLNIFPDVQRDIIPRKVSSLRRYILSGLDGKDDSNLRFFSAVTVTCKGFMFYDEANRRVAIDIKETKLSINDGQHRFEAIRTAIAWLEEEFSKSNDKERTSRLKRMIDELTEMVIPVVIFNGLTEREEKQLFHDLNNLAQRPSRNANIRLNQTDLFSRMARELAEENKYLKHYGVEYDKMSIHENNKNTILLSTIYSSCKEILSNEYKFNKDFLNETNYDRFKERVSETFDRLFFVLPHDINSKGKYIIEKSYVLKAISRFICYSRNYDVYKFNEDQIFNTIADVDWTYNLNHWSMYGGVRGNGNNIIFGGGNGGGFKAVYDALIERATITKEREDRRKVIEFQAKETKENA